MGATVIPLRRRADPPGEGAKIEAEAGPGSIDVGAILAELRERRDKLSAVIEGLRVGDLAQPAAVGPLAAGLEALTLRALAEVNLLIRRAERPGGG